MIVDSMTYDDILKVYWEDKKLVNHKIEAGNKFYSRMLKNARLKDRIYYEPMRFKSSRGINYVLMFFNLDETVPGKNRLGCFYYAWFIKNRGMYAITLTQLNRSVYHNTIYHPHFFDRYRERFLKDKSISKQDVIHTYLTNNPKSAPGHIPSVKYPNDYWMATTDGLCLCNMLGGTLIEAKTFITWDMAGVDQKEIVLAGKQNLLKQGFDIALPDEDFEEFEKEDIDNE